MEWQNWTSCTKTNISSFILNRILYVTQSNAGKVLQYSMDGSTNTPGQFITNFPDVKTLEVDALGETGDLFETLM